MRPHKLFPHRLAQRVGKYIGRSHLNVPLLPNGAVRQAGRHGFDPARLRGLLELEAGSLLPLRIIGRPQEFGHVVLGQGQQAGRRDP